MFAGFTSVIVKLNKKLPDAPELFEGVG